MFGGRSFCAGGDTGTPLCRQHKYLAKGDKVIVLGYERQRIRETGRVVETDWAMVFVVRDGRIARFRNYVDTRATQTATETQAGRDPTPSDASDRR